MATRWKDLFAQCPFFRGTDGKKTITCQGVDGYSLLTWRFRGTGHCEIQFRVFCCGKYENCEVCRMLMEAEEGK